MAPAARWKWAGRGRVPKLFAPSAFFSSMTTRAGDAGAPWTSEPYTDGIFAHLYYTDTSKRPCWRLLRQKRTLLHTTQCDVPERRASSRLRCTHQLLRKQKEHSAS
jgi:hypothetical protein